MEVHNIIPADTPELMKVVWQIRNTVFTIEQQIPAELDKDGKDADAVNVLLREGEEWVATGRVATEGRLATLARIAVLPRFRGKGYAGFVVSALEGYARAKGAEIFDLYPHSYLEGFYQKLGYSRDPEYVSSVAGHQLIRMSKGT